MAGALPAPDESRDRLAAWTGRIDQLAGDTQRMNDHLLNLELTERSRCVELAHVSQTDLDTIREAKAQVAEAAKEIIESTLGKDSATGRAIADRVHDQLMPLSELEERW